MSAGLNIGYLPVNSAYIGGNALSKMYLGIAEVLSGGWSPSELFAAGEQGAWYDPSDLTTMFQDAAGTTPVTGVEQPVGLLLDKSGVPVTRVYGPGSIATGSNPVVVTVSSDGTSVYAANSGSNTLSIYTRNTSTGALTSAGTIATGANPYGVTISSDGTSVYAANSGSNTLSIYTRNTSTGALTPNGTIDAGTGPRIITVSSDGTSVYVTNYGSNTLSIYTRNTSTGALTSNGTIDAGTGPYGVTISSGGTSVYATNYSGNTLSIYTRNTSTGALTSAGTIATGTSPRGVTISSDGTSVYAANQNSNTLSIYTRNTSTGALTSNGTIDAGIGPRGVTISSDGTSVYAANYSGNTLSIYKRTTSGNHASQATLAARPVLSARYNLLQYSESFGTSAYWQTASTVTIQTNQTTAPDGTNTADLMTEAATPSAHRVSANNNAAVISGGPTLTLSCYYKPNTGNPFAFLLLGDLFGNNQVRAWFNLQTGVKASSQTTGAGVITSYMMEPAANGFFRCTLTGTVGGASVGTYAYVAMADADLSVSYVGSTDRSVFIWGADLRVANDGVGLPPYQRVGAGIPTTTNPAVTGTADYDTVGFPTYLRFDGTDDCLFTGNINFSATDKMTVWAGVRKLSDATTGGLLQLSNSVDTNNGSFYLVAPSGANPNYRFLTRGTVFGASTPSTDSFPAPITNVLVGLAEIASDYQALRINGVLNATGSIDQGSGNFGNYPLYIGTRPSATSFTGRVYSLIVRGALTSSRQLEQTENWIEVKTFGKDMNYVYSDELTTASGEAITTADGDQIYITSTYQ